MRARTAAVAGGAGLLAFGVGLIGVFVAGVELGPESLATSASARAVLLLLAMAVAGAASAATIVAVITRMDEGAARPTAGPLVLLGLWPLVFGIGGMLDGAPPGEPVWQAPAMAVTALASGLGLGWILLRR